MKYIIDRIEENIAVLENEDGEMTNVELSLMYEGAKEGDRVLFENGVYILLPEERGSAVSRFAKLSRRRNADERK